MLRDATDDVRDAEEGSRWVTGAIWEGREEMSDERTMEVMCDGD